jgi:hypothetical protein
MINHPMDGFQIGLFEDPQRLVDLALSLKFDERLSLPRSGCRVWTDLEKQGL